MVDVLSMLGGGKRRKSQKKGGDFLVDFKEKMMKDLNITGGKKSQKKGGNFLEDLKEKISGGDGIPQQMKDYIITQAKEYLTGGKKPLTKKGEYIQKLNKHSLIKIQNYAKSLGLEIKKRYNGKIINITKKNLIKKIANLKFK